MTTLAVTGRVTLFAFVALVLVTVTVGCFSENPASQDAAREHVTSDAVVVAAGNIAKCGDEGDIATARVVRNIVLTNFGSTVLALGDNAYPKGTAESFEECYDPTWGHFKHRTRPVPGNHEYYTKGAAGYFGYFGKAAGDPDEGYYSYDLGAWHIVALNSNCETGEIHCTPASPQMQWLKEDLAANDEKACTLAYFHHPLFTSGKYRPGFLEVRPFWEALYEAGADVVLSAHDHNYQRFAPQDPEGRADPEQGIREFVVGTGGAAKPYAIRDPIANTEVYNDQTNGILKLTLRPEGYEWRFVPVVGEKFTDSGSARCH
jgi:calcineurin-like phosphoesterase family protein